ncbi:Transporter, LysE family [Marinobacterium lacunae]|uniref:Transporter, LysE family n=1 Tax=Marinobacterium lacunae TaxID=1232683 RepID=A0A081FWT5_9GAMM|nr:LysE family translocator [Marinobacterium lacunae]KEA62990.1 Transporter, LysE family [Marinobacterium lacunae]
MDAISPLLAYAAALSIAAVIPGPGIAALVGQSLGAGLRASMFFLAGIALGDLVYLSLAVAGLAAIAQLFAGAFLIVKVLGGLYLIYLAYKFWTSEAGLTRVNDVKNRRGLKAFLAGFAVTLGNPKTVVFYLALLPTVLDLTAVGLSQWSALCLLTITVIFATLAPYAILAYKAQGLMSQSGTLVRLNRIAAGIIGGAGVLILGQAATMAARRT